MLSSEVDNIIGAPFVLHGRSIEGFDCLGVFLHLCWYVGLYVQDPMVGPNRKQCLEYFHQQFVGLPAQRPVLRPLDLLWFPRDSKLSRQHVAVVETEYVAVQATRGVGVARARLADTLKRKPRAFRLRDGHNTAET